LREFTIVKHTKEHEGILLNLNSERFFNLKKIQFFPGFRKQISKQIWDWICGPLSSLEEWKHR